MPNPFVGPRPLAKNNPIFGRNREITELRHRLISERLVLLHSPSGAGKSSLINAGLIPELEGHFDVWEPTRVNTEPPAEINSNRYVWSAIYNWKKDGDETTLAEFVHARPRRKNPLLIFDQFEEILRVNPTDTHNQNEFFQQLAALLADPRIWALIVIREDYLAPLLPYFAQLPTHLRTRYRLDFLTKEHARQAARETARTGDRTFQDTALETLVNNLAAVKVQNADGSYAAEPVIGTYVEPMQLQVVCRRLWDDMPEADRSIDPEDVAQFGDVTQALGAYYDSAVKDDRAIREWFHEKLIKGGIRSQVQMGPERSEGLSNKIIERLLDTHLVRAEERRRSKWFELAHDRLIEPVQRSNEAWFNINLHPTQRRAELWLKQNRLDALLLPAEELNSARNWIIQNGTILTEAEQQFFVASEKKRLLEEERELAARREAEQNNRLRRALSRALRIEARSLIANGLKATALARFALALRLDSSSLGARAGIADMIVDTLRCLPTGVTVTHGAAVRWACFSPDGVRLLTASMDHTAQIWDAGTGKPIGPPLAHKGPVNTAAFSPDGRLVLTASEDHTAQLWDGLTGNRIGSPFQHKDAVNDAAFGSNGQLVATASKDRTVQIWDVASGQKAGAPLVHENSVHHIAFSRNGKFIATAMEPEVKARIDGRVQMWDATTGKKRGDRIGEGIARGVAFSSDNTRILIAEDCRVASIWTVSPIEKAGISVEHEGSVTSASLSSDGKWLLTASEDHTATVFSVSALTERRYEPMRHRAAVWSATFSSDVRRVITASEDATAQVWAPVNTLPPRFTSLRFEDGAVLGDFRADGLRVALMSETRAKARIFDVATGQPIGAALTHSNTITNVAYSPDGRLVATASFDKSVKFWDAVTGRVEGDPLVHPGRVNSVAFSPDGLFVVTVTESDTARMWSVAKRECIVKFEHEGGFFRAAFSRDGRRVLTAGFRAAQLWDAATGTTLGKPMPHKHYVYRAIFSADERLILTASGDNTAQVWDTATGLPVGGPLQHKEELTSAAFSPDGRRVVTASHDKTARIWDAASGEALGRPILHDTAVLAALFTPDGQRVITLAGNVLSIRDVLIDAGTPEDVQLLAEFAEGVDGYRVDDEGSATQLDQAAALRAVVQKARALPDTPGTIAYFIRRYIPE